MICRLIAAIHELVKKGKVERPVLDTGSSQYMRHNRRILKLSEQ